MKHLFHLALLCLGSCIALPAQQIYFPRLAATDSSVLHKAMPILAKELVLHLTSTRVYAATNTNLESELKDLLVVQMLAGQFAAAEQTINSYRSIYQQLPEFAEMLEMRNQLYCAAKLESSAKGTSFSETFAQLFKATFLKLGDEKTYDFDGRFINNLPVIQVEIQRALKKQIGKDSISVWGALALCRQFNAYQIGKSIIPIVKPILQAEYNQRYITQDSVLITTRDGAKIAAIVIRKKGATAPLPVVLLCNVYAGPRNIVDAREAAARGYVGVVVNPRGKSLSPDEFFPYETDGQDVYDVIDWISKQAWCNGKVGMWGGSYLGFTQWAATKGGVHPALKTIVPAASVAPGIDFPMENNVSLNFPYSWTYYVGNNKFLDDTTYNDRDRWSNLNFDWYDSGVAYRLMDSLDGRANKIFRRWLEHPAYDAYWQAMVPYQQDFAKINIPILSLTGYYDGGQISALYYLKEHYKYNPKAEHYLLIGPYGHIECQGSPTAYSMGYQLDQAAVIDIHKIIYEWLDHVLKGGSKPTILQDKINYQIMGTNTWGHAASLAKMSNDSLTFYLSETPYRGQHLLAMKKPARANFLTQTIDFADRSNQNNYYTPFIVNEELWEGNGLAFVSDTFKRSFYVNGSFSGNLKAIVNKVDFDPTVVIYECRADGTYVKLSHFIGRASYAKDKSKRQLLVPGKLESIPFSNTRMVSKKIEKGSRLLILLNVNKNPFEQINYGTGKEVSDENIRDAKVPLQVKWRNDSWIKVPVWRVE